MHGHNNADFAAGIVMQEIKESGFFREWTQASSHGAFPVAISLVACLMLYLTTKSQLQERWYFADLVWRSKLFINRKCPVEKFLSVLCCSCDTTNPSNFRHDIYKLVEKQPFQFWSFLGEYFTYSRVGETVWRGLSEVIKIPCEMWMAFSVISDISARCYITEWGDFMNPRICTESRVVLPCTLH